MAAAAILNCMFVQYFGRCVCRAWNLIQVPNFVQMCATINELWAINEIYNGGRRHLEIYYFCWFWSNVLGLFPVAAVYITAKFHSSTSIGGWFFAVCAKIQDGGAAILNYNFVMLDHPQSPFVHLKFPFKFRVDRVRTFRDIAIQKFRKFGLKCLFRPPKSCFQEFWPPIFFYHRDPQKETESGNTRFEP